MKKDLTSIEYWRKFAEYGFAMSRHDQPSPREVGDTVVRLMNELRDEESRVAEAEKDGRVLLQEVDIFLMRIGNEAGDLGYRLRKEHETKSAAYKS